MQTIDIRQIANLIKDERPIELVDVRTPVEFRALHATGARNIPLDRIDAHEMRQGDGADETIYLICQTGNRSRSAAKKLLAGGLENIISVDGGTDAWVAAGLPVVRGLKAISLERQVRIAAGSLVFLGATLGFFVHPYFIGVSAFVGAGLVFAGLTDTCGMGLLIAKMPWNQTTDSCSTS
ncbi:MAG: rhodanese-like domain-containing protein [Planctomycetota bacterium]